MKVKIPWSGEKVLLYKTSWKLSFNSIGDNIGERDFPWLSYISEIEFRESIF